MKLKRACSAGTLNKMEASGWCPIPGCASSSSSAEGKEEEKGKKKRKAALCATAQSLRLSAGLRGLAMNY